MLGHVNKPL